MDSDSIRRAILVAVLCLPSCRPSSPSTVISGICRYRAGPRSHARNGYGILKKNGISSKRCVAYIWKETVTRRASGRDIMSNAAERISDVEHTAPLLRREGIGRMTCVRARVRITILGPAWCASNTRRVRLNISHAAMREVLSFSRLARSLSSRSLLANGESRPDYGYTARNETDDE